MYLIPISPPKICARVRAAEYERASYGCQSVTQIDVDNEAMHQEADLNMRVSRAHER